MSALTAGWIEELTRTISSRLVVTEEDPASDLRRRRDAMRAFERSIPEMYRSARVDHPDIRRRVSLATFPTRPPAARRVTFIGPSGAGKTTLAVALLRALLENKIASHAFVTDDDVHAMARQCRFAPAHRLGVAGVVPGDPLEIRHAMRAPVLLIDDLGKDADINSNPVPSIIVERHADERVTWITTELSPDQIAQRYGGGIARRIFERAESIRFD